jgi:hypothetical protein
MNGMNGRGKDQITKFFQINEIDEEGETEEFLMGLI